MKHSSSPEDQLLYLKATSECTSLIFLPIFSGTLNDFRSETRRRVRRNQLKLICIVILTRRLLCIKESITLHREPEQSQPQLCCTDWPLDHGTNLAISLFREQPVGSSPLVPAIKPSHLALASSESAVRSSHESILQEESWVFYKEIIYYFKGP